MAIFQSEALPNFHFLSTCSPFLDSFWPTKQVSAYWEWTDSVIIYHEYMATRCARLSTPLGQAILATEMHLWLVQVLLQ